MHRGLTKKTLDFFSFFFPTNIIIYFFHVEKSKTQILLLCQKLNSQNVFDLFGN
jgi:hypothetical protein